MRPSILMPNESIRDSLAEKRWLTALAQGDPSALGGLYEMYGERIFRYTYRMLGNRSDAEDATAETFLRVLRRSAELRADGAFRTWLFRIARNLCIDRLRQHGRKARRIIRVSRVNRRQHAGAGGETGGIQGSGSADQ